MPCDSEAHFHVKFTQHGHWVTPIGRRRHIRKFVSHCGRSGDRRPRRQQIDISRPFFHLLRPYSCRNYTSDDWVAMPSLYLYTWGRRCWLSFNSLWPSDAIWRQRSGSTFAQVMACCLTAPSHYLNQCWLIVSKVQRHSSEGNFTIDTSAMNHWNYLENYLSKISFKSPRGQWVDSHSPRVPGISAIHTFIKYASWGCGCQCFRHGQDCSITSCLYDMIAPTLSSNYAKLRCRRSSTRTIFYVFWKM